MTWSIFNDLQHNASWCEMQWNVHNQFMSSWLTTCIFSLNFVATPAFFQIIDGVLSVAILAARDQSTPTLFITPTRALKISLAVMVSITGNNPRNSSLTEKVSSTPRINMASSDARLFCKNKQEYMKNKPKTGNLTEKQAQHALAGKCNKKKKQQVI